MKKNTKLILGQSVYDPETRTISNSHNTPQIIGHVQARLLEKLYSEPKTYFSNEDLQRDVWDNRFIENTTIRTTVSYLRKALDESEECKYIESGRNKGYRFVANIEEISNRRRLIKFFPATVFIAMAILLIYIFLKDTPQIIVPQIQTTLLGQELRATVHDNLLVFSHKSPEKTHWNLYAKHLGQERYYQLTNGPFNDSHAVFSPNGKKIAFNRHDGISCKIMVAEIEQGSVKLTNIKIAFNCVDELLSISIAWVDENHLYLSYTESLSEHYQIYSFNLASKNILPITSPSNDSGDYYVTRSQQSNITVFFRNVSGSKTEIWRYDAQKKHSSKITSIPLVLLSAAWTDNGRKLALKTGDRQLSTLDIETGKLKLLFRTNYSIFYPYSIDQQTIGYMRGNLWVKDIVRLDVDGNLQNVITSSFNDYRPVYAQSSGDIAFVSNRTGNSQIWLQTKKEELRQLTKFKESYKIADLAISQDGKSIAFTINTQLNIIDRYGKNIYSSPKENIYKNPAFSNDGKSIYYSTNRHNKWVIETLSFINKPTESKILTEGYVITPCQIDSCFYFSHFDKPQLYKFLNGTSIYTDIDINNINSPNQIALTEESIYYLQNNHGISELHSLNLSSKLSNKMTNISSSRFSLQQKPLYFLTSVSRRSGTNLESIKIAD